MNQPKYQELSNEIGSCPNCKGENYDYGSNEIQDQILSYKVTCTYCGQEWDECYKMVFSGNWGTKIKRGK